MSPGTTQPPAGPTRRLRVLQTAVAVIFLVLSVQVLRLQVIDPRLPPEFTDGSSPRLLHVEPARGRILDRNGAVLARNTAQFRVALVAGELPEDQGARRRALVELESLLGVPYSQIEAVADSHLAIVDPHAPLTVLTGLDTEQAIALRAHLAGKPYAIVDSFPSRTYASDGALGHILGYVGAIPPDRVDELIARGYRPDGRIGLAGVEQHYEALLRGTPGQRLVLADPTGRVLDELASVDAQAGADLVLSIDLDLQRAALEALKEAVDSGMSTVRQHGQPDRPEPVPAGAAVAIDVHTGELLAMVSLPTFDPNLFTGLVEPAELHRVLTDPARPLVNRAYMEIRAPGSTFKPVVAHAALEEGVARPDTLITSTGAIAIENEYHPGAVYILRDWAAHGTLDLYNAMARSSDVYFYYLAGGFRQGGRQVFVGMGANTLAEWTRDFGFGRTTGLDLPGEEPGVVPDPDWKREAMDEEWVLGDTYTFGIGQSFLRVTPLQMVVATAAIANGGDILVPRVARGVQIEDRFEPFETQVSGRVPGSDEHWAIVQRTMWASAMQANGTGRTGVPPGMEIGGKTGTAEWGMPYPNFEYDTHGWYVGYAPYDDPRIAVAVYVEHGGGSQQAGPVARAIFDAYVNGTPDDSPATQATRP